MKLIRRILRFNKSDYKHIWWLFKNMIKEIIIGDFHEAKEEFYWIKIHLSYDSTKLR